MSVISYRPSDIKTEADVHRFLREYDKEHPPEDQFDRRLREAKKEASEAKEAEAARRQSAQQRTTWGAAVNGSLENARQRLALIGGTVLPAECRSDAKPATLTEAIGQVRHLHAPQRGQVRSVIEDRSPFAATRMQRIRLVHKLG
jgi:hypothetical protein